MSNRMVQVAAGQEATVKLDVLNTGEATGTYTAALNISGVESEV